MNKAHFYVYACLLLFMTSCNGQNQTALSQDSTPQSAMISAEQQKFHHGSKSDGISDGVRCGLLDKEGILWLGTNNGVYSYDGIFFTKFSVENGLCNNQVLAIIEDAEGNLWFGTDDGLCRYDRKTFTHIPIPFSDTSSVWLDKVYPIINPNAVHALAQDKKGNIWIGTGGAGVYRYDGEQFNSFLKLSN